MSTQAYYKERLGFDPADTVAEHHREQRSQHGYEESLSKFKDERDAIQKKTFTKWVNKHLKKTYTCLHVCVLVNNQPCCSPTASRHVGDLFVDLRDGHNLISLLEVLSGEHLPRERGRMRFHMLQNVQMALDFLRYKKIKLVNIRAEDIVDGNPKLTLGLIWTIILHFQQWRRKISDIVVGQEPNVTAREALLRWARRSTARYPGVRVTDFTGSWRDGLAFSALIHRNRPDLVDWRGARSSQPRERLDRVFHVAEREYGVTRLLDPEDVDTPEPDEKSLITYISSLYDVFPEPPAIHPLYDAEAQRRSAEYRELANSLHMWIREKMVLMQDRSFPPTLIEMKKLAADSTKFKNEEVPPKYRDKQRLAYIFRDLQKYFEAVGEVDMEPELHIEVVEKNWNRLIMLHQEREQAIIDEIKRLERLQRLAEKVHREMKATDNRLEELERRVEDEARRLDRLHPLEAKHAVDLLEQDIRNTEIQIQNIFTDVHSLTEGRYSQAGELHKRVQKLHQRWVALRSLLHKRLVQPLSAVSFPVEERVVTKHRTTVHETRLVDTNPHFRALHDCIDWCKAKLKQLQEADYGSDLPSVQNELDVHQKEHKNIEQFQTKIERCVQSKSNFHGEELTLYSQHLGVLQKLYTDLQTASTKRLSDLDTLHDFIQSATGELVWLNSKEETEVTRDWSDKSLNIQSIEQYYESLMSDLEKREIQFSAVQDRGEALVLQHHPAAKTIEAYMSAMQSQWAWLLQLTLCLEVHLKHAAQSQQFFREVQQAEQWITKRDETLNSVYSQFDFSLDEGDRLLKGMQELREELNSYGDQVQKLVEQAKDIVPMKQRRQPVNRPFQVTCVCSYKQVNMTIEKGEQCMLYDNSGRVKWRVKNQQGVESPVPGVCFALQPPDKDALDAAERLRRQYDRSISLWQRKQLRLRQNMIFATIKVVKGWDLPQFLAMGQDQRTAIRKALNEDADKLLSEGDPADPQLRRLKREMAEVNKLFDDLEKRARAEEESKNAGRIFNDQVSLLQQALEEAERTLNARIASPLPRDLDSLEHSVLQHKDYEQSLQRLAPDVERVQQTFRGITLKTPAMRNKLDNVTQKWNHILSLSGLYIERLKCVEIVLSSLEENTNTISEFEVKLASFDELPSDVKGLQNVLEELMVLQNSISQQQAAIDQLNDDAHNARRLVEKSRPSHRGPHADMDRLDAEVNKLNARWTNICGQLVDRLRSAETAYQLVQQYEHAYRNEADFVEESYGKLDVENAKNLLSKVVERAPAIEAVNVTGGRLIREGKIYGQRLRAFKEQLEDVCPSLDASVKKPRRDYTDFSTVDNVARQLDNLNRRYTSLVTILQDRVRQLAAHDPEDASLQRALREQRPLRTFRTEFNIYESTTCEERYTTTTTHYTQSQYSSERHETCERSETIVSSDSTRQASSQENEARGLTAGPQNGRPVSVEVGQSKETIGSVEGVDGRGEESLKRHRETGVVGAGWSVDRHADRSRTAAGSSMRFSEIRSLKRIERSEEGVGTESVIESRGIVDPRTGETLTVGEAIGLRILDVRNGRIVASSDGRRTVSIEEAVKENLMDRRLADRLLGPCGLDEDGRSVSLLEAIQRELYDAERLDVYGDRAKVTRDPAVSFADATKDSFLDPRTGQLVTEGGERISVEEARARGYLAKLDVTVTIKRSALALADAIAQGLLEDRLGRVFDRITGDTYALDEAVAKGVVDGNSREIVDTGNDTKLTVLEALDRGILEPRTGTYLHGLSAERLTMKEARRRRLIVKPMSLKDCRDTEIIDEHGRINSPVHRSKLSIVEAMDRGVLDSDKVKSIVVSGTGETITLTEAMSRGLITNAGVYRDLSTGEELSIGEAVDRGLITSVGQKTIFDIDGFKDPATGEFISLNAALLKGLVSAESGGTYTLDLKSGETISVAEAQKRGHVRPELSDMLNRGIGIFENGREFSVLEAVFAKLLDTKSGLPLDPRTKRPVPLESAIKRGLITPDGAALLASLLNITVTAQTVTKTIRRYITEKEIITRERKYRITYEEAQARGLIDESTDQFEDPSTGELISIDHAIEKGLLGIPGETEPIDSAQPTAIGTTTTILEKDTIPSSAVSTMQTRSSVTVKPKPETYVTEAKLMIDKTTKSAQFEQRQEEETTRVSITKTREERASSSEKRVFELPAEGWTLAEAIEQRLFDPATGLFIIPGTDRLVSFEECIKLQIVNPNSSFVIDPNNGRKVSLLRSLEKGILDTTGHYTYPQKISMKEAIEKGLIILEGKRTDKDRTQQRLLRITKVSGAPDKVELTRVDDPTKPTEIKSSVPDEVSMPDPVQVSRGVIYDPSTALVISTKDGRSTGLLTALSDGSVPPEAVVVKDPNTGKSVGIREAVQRGILDPRTGEYKVDEDRKMSLLDAAKFGVITVCGTPLVAAAAAADAVKRAMVKDPRTGQEVPHEVAVQRGIVRQISDRGQEPVETLARVETTSSVEDSKTEKVTVTTTSRNTETDQRHLLRSLEPKFRVTIGQARSISASPDRDGKPVVLQKMRKKIVKPKEALENGLIDAETASIFTSEISTESGKPLTLSEAIQTKRIDADAGKIVDPQRGDVLNIKEAVERGILDPESADVLIPLAKSLSIPGLYRQGLLDPQEGKVVHPETGAHLTLSEAIVCEIVDPLSRVTCPDGRSDTLENAIANDVIDAERSLVRTERGSVNLVKAVESNVFVKDSRPVEQLREKEKKRSASPRDRSDIPPAGMTFPVALERGLIDPVDKVIKHPITEERLPLEEAINRDFIMSLPYPVASDGMEVTKALESGLIDQEKGVFVHPTTGTPIPILEAIESGLLVVKPKTIDLEPPSVPAVTETVTSFHTVTTKTFELMPGYALVNAAEVKEIETGKIVKIEEARTKGIVRDHSETKEQFTTKDIKMAFEEAVQRGLVDTATGTYTDPSTGLAMPVGQAIETGILDVSETVPEFVTPQLAGGVRKDLVETRDTVRSEATTESSSVNVQTTSSSSVSFMETAKMGLTAVIAAPMLAGMAVMDAIGKQKDDKPIVADDNRKPEEIQKPKDELRPKYDAWKRPEPEEVSEPEVGASRRDGYDEVDISTVEKQKPGVKSKPKFEETKKPEEDRLEKSSVEFVEPKKGEKEKPRESDQKKEEKPVEIEKAEREEKAVSWKMEEKDESDKLELEMTIEKHEVEEFSGQERDQVKPEVPLKKQSERFYEEETKVTKEQKMEEFVQTKRETVEERKVEEFRSVTIEKSEEGRPDKVKPEAERPNEKKPKEVKSESFEKEEMKEARTERSEVIEKSEEVKIESTRKSTEKMLHEVEAVEQHKDQLQKLSTEEQAMQIKTIEKPGKPEAPVIDATKKFIEEESKKPLDQPAAVAVIKQVEEDSKELAKREEIVDGSATPAVPEEVSEEVEEIPRRDGECEFDGAEEPEDGSDDGKRLVIEVSRDLKSRDVADLGGYDLTKEKFVDPETKEVASFSDIVLNRGVFDADAVKVKDLSAKTESYVSLREAIGRPLVDRNLGYMVDPRTGKKIPFFEAVSMGLIVQEPMEEAEERDFTVHPVSLDLQEAVDSGLIDPSTVIVRQPKTGRTFTLIRAIEEGVINPESVNVRDPETNEMVPLVDALESGEPIDLESAFFKGLLAPDTRKPIALEAAIRKGMYDEKTGRFEDPLTKQAVDIKESINRGIIDPEISECKDSKAGALVPLKDAISRSLVEVKTGRLRDTRAGELLPLNVALDRGLIVTAPMVLSLIEAIMKEYYLPRKRLVMNPVTGETTSVRAALESGYVDGRTTMIKDDRKERVLSLNEADDIGLVDLDRGTFTYPQETTLDVAFQKGYILSTVKPWSLQEALAHQTYDPERGTFNIDGGNYTLEEALESGLIGRDSPSVKDPRSGDVISVGEAIKQGLVDPKTGTALDPSADAQLPFTDALDHGLIVPAKRKISLPEAVFKGLYDPRTGTFTVPETKEKLSTERAIRVGAIDATSAIVRNADGQAITFTDAIKDQLVDPKSGTVVNESGRPIDFREALERGVLVEARRPMTFSEAISKGLLDEKTARFLDPHAGAYLTLSEAITRNLIDADSVTVKDGRSGLREGITLAEAVRTGYVDGTTGKGEDFTSLREAYDSGLIVDNRAAVSLQRAIHQGLYDEKSGRIVDPETGRSVTLHEAMRKCLVSPTLPCYWDKRAGRLLSLAETCRAGVIDRRAGTFKEPGASVSVPLTTALQLDLIVDIESAGFGLHEAILMNMYDPTTGKFTHPSSNERLTLADACRVDMINPFASIVKDTTTNRYITLSDAIPRGLVDDRKGTYRVANTGKLINLQEARRMGYVVPSKLPLILEEAVNSGLYRAESGRFVDPTTNDSYDLADAFRNGVLDPETTALKDAITGQLRPVQSGIEDGTIDPGTGKILDSRTRLRYSVDVALERGLLVTLEKPLTQRSRRTSGEEPSDKFSPNREYTIEEAIRLELLDPVYTVTRDPRTGLFIPIGKAIEDGVIGPKVMGMIEIREDRTVSQRLRFGEHELFLTEPLSLEYAIEKGFLSLANGRVTDPRTGEVSTLKTAVCLGFIDPDSALIKDTKRARLMNLADAFKEGLMDPEKGKVLDTETSRLYDLAEAIEIKLLITSRRGFSFIEALRFGLYDAPSGRFHDLFAIASSENRKRVTLTEAIRNGTINPSGTAVKDPSSGKIVSLLEAIDRERIDPVAGRFVEDQPDMSLDFVTALERGYILTAGARVKAINEQISALEREMDSMKAPGREIKLVKIQIEETTRVITRVHRLYEEVTDLENLGADSAADAVAAAEQVGNLRLKIGKLDDRSRDRQEQLDNTLEKLQQFYQMHANVMDEIDDCNEYVRKLKPVGSEVDTIKAQQEDFRTFKMKKIEQLTRSVESCNVLGQALVQTAGRDVNTSSIERDVEKMNERWNDLKDRLNERDRKLDVGLLQSGKFREALDGLEKWLTDTEEMVSNQKPLSSDYKVVKAQLQEQKFLKKMLLDRQNSMSSLHTLGQEVAAGADPKERKMIEKRLKDLVARFDNLTENAAERMDALEQAMGVAKQFQDKLLALCIWLEKTEKRVRDMELVPPDEEKIQQRVQEHDALHDDILSRKPDFNELTEIASQLMALVGEDEASALADKLQDAANRYAALDERSEALGNLLQRSRQGLRHLVLTYQDLQAWMENMEIRLSKYRILAVHTEKLLQQMEDLADLTEEVSTKQTEVDSTTDSGLELMRHISSDEALKLKDKLDSLQRRFNDLVTRGSDLLKHAQESLPLVQQFHDNHNRLMDWMQGAESALQFAEPREEEIIRLEMEISEYRPILDKVNAVGPQLCQLSPGEGAATIEGLVTRDNRRFDAIAEQIHRKAERIQLSKQRSLEVIGDIDDLLDWFREVDNQLREVEPPSSEPEIIRVQLKERKALNDDISSQKGRVRDVISTAKKVIREIAQHEDTSTIREKMEDLRETMEIVSALLADRLGALELALPLAEHLQDTHIGLVTWLEEAEQQVAMLPMPALRPDLIAAQQDKNEMLMQRINEHKPLVEKLNKTGEALIKLCNEEEGMKIQEVLETDTARYAALRAELRSRQQTLEQALQESSQFSDKLEGMLRALSSTAEQVNGAEPVSAHPPRLRDQMEENAALMEDLAQRSEAYAAVKRAADDVISKAGNRADPAVKDIKRKLEKLNKIWTDVQKATSVRGHTLDDTLQTAEKFWSELNGVMATLRELQDALACQAPPAAQPAAIQQQQVALQEIRQEIDQTKPEVEQVRASGHELMDLCGEPDKPEVRKHIEDLDQAWDNVTALYARREENLIDAMEKAMEFHETLQNLLEFLQEAEEKFARMGPLGSDIVEVKKQIKQLANFKAEVDPHMVKVEALNRQAAELTERTSSEQAAAIKEPLGAVNRRWDGLLRGMVERQRLLENALLRLGQFQHALDELLVWIEKTDGTLDGLKPVAGDPQVIEVELAKLKVLVNDIQAHQTSVDTLNDAGRQLIEDGKGTTEASTTAEKLGTLNRRWRDLLQRAADRQRELEDALREAQSFTAEIQDLLSWLGDVDNTIVSSKPVGGLPETASEQLERFMEVYNELEQNRPKVETVLHQGQEYLKRADSSSAGGLNHNLRSLKQRWDSVTARASDKKIKLEIALKEATEFHDALQAFVDWLTNAEKILTNLKPVSRVMETILSQIEEHKSFQKDVGVHRETMLNLDKKGTHLKYFSQKQDVILIKNLLISVQHRWERVVSKSAERTRALDHGYKEAREFHDAWSNLMNWLDETEKTLDEVAADGIGGNDPEKIKSRLNKHREIQKALSSKQGNYDSTMKTGKSLKDKAPKSDEFALKELLYELKNKWTTVCGKCVDRQRKLEEALLFSGQFKDAIQALLEWLTKSEKQLSNTGPLHGDLDTVTNLVEQHRTFEKDLESRASQMESVIRTGRELVAKATCEDVSAIDSQLTELTDLWNSVTRLSSEKTVRLDQALREAERLHKSVHMLLDWLSDAEMKLRFVSQLPEDEHESRNQLFEHEKFLQDLSEKEVEKDDTLELAQGILAKAHPDGAAVIKHWITIIQSRWEEVSAWAQQRNQRLENHMRGLQDLDNLLEELLAWLEGLENTLNALEAEPLPDDRATLEMLIADHREFMENTSQRQNEVDRVCKARQIKPAKDARKVTKAKSPAPTRGSPGRDRTPDLSLPHIGPRFPPKGSKGAEPEFRSPRVKLLWDRWRHVWMLAWERQRRLQDKYNYIQELDRVANFSWEDWRKRFLKFMNHKKSRLTDLFRKMDKNNDGLIPREDFIQGIMNTKFETSRLEMGAVADLFDRQGEGLIDWKEFIAALRPDWEERRTHNDTDKIHDEVKRLVMLCTCRQKFRVFQVGEGKYRFGDSQKLRLVRILRSTVMVRVGGGWVALDEFLLKNDPCRAKGRTNIELREQFILADGVSQTMTAFRSKPSPTSTLQRNQISSPNTGPITKVRERSARSVPMGQTRASRTSLNAGTPDSLSDNESSFRIGSARKTSTPHRSALTPGGSRPSSRPASRPASRPTSRPGSRPASRQGSKPPSRYGSTQSLDSTDDSSNPSRIPRRTTTGSTPTSSRHNSVSGKRFAGTPVNGSSSRPRTPTGLISPASGVSARFGTIHRASSIPTLTGVGTPISRSRIPVYVGADIKSPQSTTSNISTISTQSNHSTVSSDSTGSSSMCANSTTNIPSAVKQSRTRTPSSGSSTPLPPSLKLSRKPSGASDTSVSSTPTARKGKPTPIDQRAPFRL